MCTGLKLNVKNVILGCYNLSRHDTRFFSRFSQLAVPRVIDFNKSTQPDCPYYKRDYVRRHTLNHAEASLKGIPWETPLISKRIHEVHNRTGRIFIPGCLLPWETPIRSYYERKDPKCPPPCPKIHKDCRDPPVPPCPPIVKIPKCPKRPKCGPCKVKKRPCKFSPCTLSSLPLYNCRFYSASPCQPKLPSKKRRPRFCKPMREVIRPVPKCPSPVRSGRPRPGGKKLKVCQPKYECPEPKPPKEC